jgi:type 2 lantibiotic biosynthesis protein LanM
MEPLPSIDWVRALNLQERSELFRSGQLRKPEPNSPAEQRAMQRMIAWRDKRHEKSDARLDVRLGTVSITSAEFRDILALEMDCTSTATASCPAWVEFLVVAFAPENTGSPQRFDPNNPQTCFARAFQPFMDAARAQISGEARRLIALNPLAPFTVTVFESVFAPELQRRLSEIVNPTLVQEMFSAKKRNGLVGDTPALRFENFVAGLDRPTVWEILCRYPVLARVLSETTRQWIYNIIELLQRIVADRESIRDVLFAGIDAGILASSQVAGDFHQGGKAVRIVTFSSGNRVVYKPRPVETIVHFHRLLEWCNARRGGVFLCGFRVLERDGYGWLEFVDRKPCFSADDVERFYMRQGSYLALLHVLNATDFHCDNVIASAEHPILVDVETLFQALVFEPNQEQPNAVGRVDLAQSVLRTGLLPLFVGGDQKHGGVQLGGLATRGELEKSKPVPKWIKVGTDEMCRVREPTLLPATANVPIFLGKRVNFVQYENVVISAFSEMYRFLMANAGDLISPNGALEQFSEDTTRILLRETDFYATILRESYHPSLMQDALERDEVFDHLWNVFTKRPEMVKVIPSEYSDFWTGDIPLFESKVNSRHVWDSRGRRFTDYLSASGLSAVRHRLQNLSERDLKRQIVYIRSSFAASVGYSASSAIESGSVSPAVRPDILLDAAIRVAGHLEESLVTTDGRRIDWVGLLPQQNGRWAVSPVGFDLYNGLAGIALFLGFLGDVTKNQRLEDMSRRALDSMFRYVDSGFVRSALGFDGFGGVLFVLSHLGVRWNDQQILKRATRLVSQMRSFAAQQKQLDVLAGAAGGLGGLLSLHRAAPSQDAIDAIKFYAENIRDSWGPKEFPLTGFGHGAAGIALNLARAAHVTKDVSLLARAKVIIDYERTLYSDLEKNWRDLRGDDQTRHGIAPGCKRFPVAWCHGSVGIGLSRLALTGEMEIEGFDREVLAAVESTVSHTSDNDSLCHGEAGCLELLAKASGAAIDGAVGEHLARRAASLVHRAVHGNLRCGVPNGVETPGFMIGLSGIGYQLLRLARPNLPSVLLLEPPGTS